MKDIEIIIAKENDPGIDLKSRVQVNEKLVMRVTEEFGNPFSLTY